MSSFNVKSGHISFIFVIIRITRHHTSWLEHSCVLDTHQRHILLNILPTVLTECSVLSETRGELTVVGIHPLLSSNTVAIKPNLNDERANIKVKMWHLSSIPACNTDTCVLRFWTFQIRMSDEKRLQINGLIPKILNLVKCPWPSTKIFDPSKHTFRAWICYILPYNSLTYANLLNLLGHCSNVIKSKRLVIGVAKIKYVYFSFHTDLFCYFTYQTMQTYRGLEVLYHTFLNSALDVGERFDYLSDNIFLKNPGTRWLGGRVGLKASLVVSAKRKILPVIDSRLLFRFLFNILSEVSRLLTDFCPYFLVLLCVKGGRQLILTMWNLC